jgi:hypothetical protein
MYDLWEISHIPKKDVENFRKYLVQHFLHSRGSESSKGLICTAHIMGGDRFMWSQLFAAFELFW